MKERIRNHSIDIQTQHDYLFDMIRKNVMENLHDRNMNLKDLSRKADWYYTALHKVLYERQSISLLSMVRLASAFEIDICDLIKEEIKKI